MSAATTVDPEPFGYPLRVRVDHKGGGYVSVRKEHAETLSRILCDEGIRHWLSNDVPAPPWLPPFEWRTVVISVNESPEVVQQFLDKLDSSRLSNG